MNTEFIKATHQIFSYQLKEGTKTSFRLCSGKKCFLPERLSLTNYTGKAGLRNAKFQIQGKYKKEEEGTYYFMNNREIHTKIMEVNNYPLFIGWGEIDVRFKVYDLLIIHSQNNCKESFQIHHFKGLAKPEYLESVCKYLQTIINNKSPNEWLL
jgi:hypothetical protein